MLASLTRFNLLDSATQAVMIRKSSSFVICDRFWLMVRLTIGDDILYLVVVVVHLIRNPNTSGLQIVPCSKNLLGNAYTFLERM